MAVPVAAGAPTVARRNQTERPGNDMALRALCLCDGYGDVRLSGMGDSQREGTTATVLLARLDSTPLDFPTAPHRGQP